MRLSQRFRCLAWLLALPAATGLCSDGVSASERLELARQKLVEQTLRASARVDAISWTDTTGRLHEHQSMRQSIVWPAPLDNPARDVRDLLLESQRPVAGCGSGPDAAGLLPTLALTTRWSFRLSQGLRERLDQTVRLQWLGSDDSTRAWRMFHVPTGYASTYHQRLLAPPVPESDWRAELRAEVLPSPSRDIERLQWHLALTQHQRLVTELHAVLDLPVEPQPWGHAVWTESAWQVIEQQLRTWSSRMSNQLSCVRAQPVLQATASGGWQLNMGRLAGMQVGDEWALVDPAWLPERALEPTAIDKMVIARVVKVEDTRSEIVTMAGDARLPRPGWVAHPLNVRAASLPVSPTGALARR